jgi:hypothetical protein
MSYIGRTDLQDRGWVYTRQGIDYLIKHPDFPAPAFTLNGGRVLVWDEADIEEFEERNPRLFNERLKIDHVRGYARAIQKKERREG